MYSNEAINQDVLDFACTASHQLEEQFSSEEGMRGKLVCVDAEMLHHVYSLLIAYSLTYEGYHCVCGCFEEIATC